MKLQNVTDSSQAQHGRWYDDACGTAFAMELVGERWSLLIVRELLLGPRRFTDLRAGLPGISAKVLTERLDSLERTKILFRRQLPPPTSVQVYELTKWGYLAEKPIQALGYWAACSPDHDPTLPMSATSLIVSFRTMFDPSRAGGLVLDGRLEIAGEAFRVSVRDNRLVAERGSPDSPDFVLSSPDTAPIGSAVYCKVPFADLREAGLGVEGSEPAARSFIDLFHLPAKAR